ncbi:MAG TPA: hypothetical protein VKP11_03960 [Frankiaceae bacterium]|nr:hypothetical protein [Frankiaceae bacterium]
MTARHPSRGRRPRRPAQARRALLAAAAALAVLAPAASCGSAQAAAPGCGEAERLAVVAQSVPGASYLPCLNGLPEGWRLTRFDVARGHTRMSLLSDRAGGRAARVELTDGCEVGAATPDTPRAVGVRSYTLLRSITGRYAGTRYDVFPGGCVSYRFDFDRGPHIALMEQLDEAVGLVPRRELHDRLGVELDP